LLGIKLSGGIRERLWRGYVPQSFVACGWKRELVGVDTFSTSKANAAVVPGALV
jgi:hypothetical protein